MFQRRFSMLILFLVGLLSVVGLAVVTVPATAAGCVSLEEFRNVEVREMPFKDGWHRQRVINAFDVQPTYELWAPNTSQTNADREDFWGQGKTCGDWVVNIGYNAFGQGPSLTYNVVRKCRTTDGAIHCTNG